MEIEGLRRLVARHAVSTNALVALGMALDARVGDTTLDSEVASRVMAVLDELGVTDVVTGSDSLDLAPVLAGIRADLFFGGKVLSGKAGAAGWQHQEPELLQAFGDVSGGFPSLLKRLFAPQLTDLEARLQAPGAAFLDIGVGVGALSLAMLRQWPELRVVGIDPSKAALALAAVNIETAGAASSVELRIGSGEDVSDREAFDLVFVPTAFIPEVEVRKIIPRLLAALRPGGWVLVAMVNPGTDQLGAALARFRTVLWGGTVFADGEAGALLERCGYVDCRMLPGPAGAPVAFFAGRRSPS